MARVCLVVDDSRVVRKVARRILEAHGFDVTEAGDGQQALDACRAQYAGLRAARLEHAGDERPRIPPAIACRVRPDKPPVVFCTTETEMSSIELAITNGAQEYIMKPFDEEILIGKFEQVGLL